MNIRIEYPKCLKVGGIVNIFINEKNKFTGIVSYCEDRYYLDIIYEPNDVIFDLLFINKKIMMEELDIPYYKGGWPEVTKIKYLKKQLKYIEFYNER